MFLLIMTTLGLLIQLKSFYDKQDWFLFTLDIIVLIAAILITLEVRFRYLVKSKKEAVLDEASKIQGLF
ncbi:hypothetical protein ACT691_05400 [Vibrio metschnikovii]